MSRLSQSNRTIKSIVSSQPSGRSSRLLQPKKNNLLQMNLKSEAELSEG